MLPRPLDVHRGSGAPCNKKLKVPAWEKVPSAPCIDGDNSPGTPERGAEVTLLSPMGLTEAALVPVDAMTGF